MQSVQDMRNIFQRFNQDELSAIGKLYVEGFTVLEKSTADFVAEFLTGLSEVERQNIVERSVFTPEENDQGSINVQKLLERISDDECLALQEKMNKPSSHQRKALP